MTILLYDLVGNAPDRPFSPHCWKIAMALAHKGLEFRRIGVPFTQVATLEAGTARSVPLIRDGERLVGDSFAIAVYLEDAYPERPTLFAGNGGRASARFIERWSQLTLHPYLGAAVLCDIHACLAPLDQEFFRNSREKRFGRTLEEVAGDRDAKLPAFRASLDPLRSVLTYQPWLGGELPLFSDYVVFGALQWVRVASGYPFLKPEDPITGWFNRCLDLHDKLGRSVSAAAGSLPWQGDIASV